MTQCLAVSLFALVVPLTVSAQPLKLQPIPISTAINGVTVTIPVDTWIGVSTDASRVLFSVRSEADLGDLQAKFDAIVGSYPLPREKCGARWFLYNNRLTPDGDAARVALSGRCEWYWCHWALECAKVADLGLLGKHCVEWRRNDAEEGPVTQPFDGSLLMRAVAEAQAVRPDVTVASVNLGGPGGRLTQAALEAFIGDLRGKVQAAVNGQLNVGTLSVGIPADLKKYEPTFKTVRFVDRGGGRLSLIGEASVSLTADQLSEALRTLLPK